MKVTIGLARKDISENNIREALEKLETISPIDNQIANGIISLKGRVSEVNGKTLNNVISNEEADRIMSKIRTSILELINTIETKDASDEKTKEKEITSNTSSLSFHENMDKKEDTIKESVELESNKPLNENASLKPVALIMKGGGIKGLAYVGALQELTKHYQFNWFVGTSAGAISAVLLGSGYTIAELKGILEETSFHDKIKTSFFKRYFVNLLFKGGLHEGMKFTNWLQELLSEKLDMPNEVRLEDLPKRVSIYATKRYERAVIFDSENSKKETSAAFAVRCSMSIPLFFVPQKMEGLHVFDGGVQNNYPVNILLEHNPGTEFIGLYLGDEHFQGHKRPNNIFFDLLSITTEANDYDALRRYRDNTVVIDTAPISTLNFDLSKDEKEFLLECGRVYAIKFLRRQGVLEEGINYDLEKKKLEGLRDKLKRKKRKRNWSPKILSFLALTLLFYFLIVINNKDSLIKELGISGYYLIQTDKNDCGIPDLFNYKKANNCLPKDYKKLMEWEIYNTLLINYSIRDTAAVLGDEFKQMLSFSTWPFSDRIDVAFCFKNRPQNAIGFKIDLSESITNHSEFNPLRNEEKWAIISEDGTEFLYREELPNKCVKFSIKKETIPK